MGLDKNIVSYLGEIGITEVPLLAYQSAANCCGEKCDFEIGIVFSIVLIPLCPIFNDEDLDEPAADRLAPF